MASGFAVVSVRQRPAATPLPVCMPCRPAGQRRQRAAQGRSGAGNISNQLRTLKLSRPAGQRRQRAAQGRSGAGSRGERRAAAGETSGHLCGAAGLECDVQESARVLSKVRCFTGGCRRRFLVHGCLLRMQPFCVCRVSSYQACFELQEQLEAQRSAVAESNAALAAAQSQIRRLEVRREAPCIGVAALLACGCCPAWQDLPGLRDSTTCTETRLCLSIALPPVAG